MSATQEEAQEPKDYGRAIEFAYAVVKDTQDTIRFLDTKAAFSVTLLTAALAVILQLPATRFQSVHWLLVVFLTVVGASLLLFLRVISPTIRPPRRHVMALSGGPRFYVGPGAKNHRLRHALSSPTGNILSETHESYLESLLRAGEPELLSSLSATITTLSVIRQVKSDRLHVALFGLVLGFLLFAVLMML